MSDFRKPTAENVNVGHYDQQSFPTDQQMHMWWDLQDTRELPDWMYRVQSWRYTADEMAGLIKQAKTHPET